MRISSISSGHKIVQPSLRSRSGPCLAYLAPLREILGSASLAQVSVRVDLARLCGRSQNKHAKIVCGGGAGRMSRVISFGLFFCFFLRPLAADQRPAQESLRDWAVKNQARQAYGVYIKDRKIGWFLDEA